MNFKKLFTGTDSLDIIDSNTRYHKKLLKIGIAAIGLIAASLFVIYPYLLSLYASTMSSFELIAWYAIAFIVSSVSAYAAYIFFAAWIYPRVLDWTGFKTKVDVIENNKKTIGFKVLIYIGTPIYNISSDGWVNASYLYPTYFKRFYKDWSKLSVDLAAFTELPQVKRNKRQ